MSNEADTRKLVARRDRAGRGPRSGAFQEASAGDEFAKIGFVRHLTSPAPEPAASSNDLGP